LLTFLGYCLRMAETITNELMYEVLKRMQTDIAVIKAEVADVKAMQLRLREDFNRSEGDLLRFERIESGTQLRLDRIETRLNLTDA
jgi:hypothetical protein